MNRKLSKAFPEIGKIRKGAPKVLKTNRDGKKYESVGADLENKFRFIPAGNDPDITAAWIAEYGSLQPSVIRASFVWKQVDDCWSWGDTAYAGSQMKLFGKDGYVKLLRAPNGAWITRSGILDVQFDYVVDDGGVSFPEFNLYLKGFKVESDGHPYRLLTYEPGACYVYERDGRRFVLKLRPEGRMKLWIPAFDRLVQVLLQTNSYYDCINIDAMMGGIQDVADVLNQGAMSGIGVLIYRSPVQISRMMDDGVAARTTKWLIQVEADPAWVRVATAKLREMSFGSGPISLQLPASAAPVPFIDVDASAVDPDEDEEQEADDPEMDPVLDAVVAPPAPAPAPAVGPVLVRNPGLNLAQASTFVISAYNKPLGQLTLAQLGDLLTTMRDRQADGKPVSAQLLQAIELVFEFRSQEVGDVKAQ